MKRTMLILVLTAVLMTAFALPAFVNAAEPPCFTVLVNGAPEEVTEGMVLWLFRKKSRPRAALASLCANAVSLTVGGWILSILPV
ncbi:MAG: hypothetical protein IKY52_14170 [Clostridia bacterium]|nr:hypothetical protein [Clostridia bacterium]